MAELFCENTPVWVCHRRESGFINRIHFHSKSVILTGCILSFIDFVPPSYVMNNSPSLSAACRISSSAGTQVSHTVFSCSTLGRYSRYPCRVTEVLVWPNMADNVFTFCLFSSPRTTQVCRRFLKLICSNPPVPEPARGADGSSPVNKASACRDG